MSKNTLSGIWAALEERSGMKRNSRAVGVGMLVAFLMLLPVPARAGLPRSPSAGNGYILMIHATFEPRSHPMIDAASTGHQTVDQTKTGTTYGSGGLGATRDDDAIVFHAIPYRTSTVRPAVVARPYLKISLTGGGQRLFAPNVLPEEEGACRFETDWYGHEGAMEACTAYRIPVSEFEGVNVVFLALLFQEDSDAREEVHDAIAHASLHAAILNTPIDLNQVDKATGRASPFAIESVLDPQGGPWRSGTSVVGLNVGGRS